MARLNDFFTRIDLSILTDYAVKNGRIVKYSRGEVLCRESEICRYIGIVRSGYFKFVSLGSKGEECVTGFSFEDEAVFDYVQSFLQNSPSLTSIVAGSDAEIVQVPLADLRNYLLEDEPDFIVKTSAVLLQEAYRRYIDLYVKTPSQRYAELCQRCHESVSIIPLQEIASYLTISRRQLHRIRGER